MMVCKLLLIEPVNIKHPSGHCFFVWSTWMLMSTLLTVFYTRNMTSLILITTYKENPIDTADELIRSSKNVLIKKGSSYFHTLNKFPKAMALIELIDAAYSLENILARILENPETYATVRDIQDTYVQAILHNHRHRMFLVSFLVSLRC